MFQHSLKIINAIIYTIRPSATLGACLLVLAAYHPQMGELNQVIFLMIATFFGSAYCFLVNDIYDREKDLKNEKFRPVATGSLPLRTAIAFSVMFALIFIFSTWFLGYVAFGLSFVFLFITTFYSHINLKSGFPANATVAFVVSGTQWGVAIIKPDDYLWMSSIFLFVFTLPREMLLDWLDVRGDLAVGKSSVPTQVSTKSARLIIVCLLLAASGVIAFGLYILNPHGISFIFFVLTILSVGGSYIPFLRKASHQNILSSIRLSHVTFAFLILALLSR